MLEQLALTTQPAPARRFPLRLQTVSPARASRSLILSGSHPVFAALASEQAARVGPHLPDNSHPWVFGVVGNGARSVATSADGCPASTSDKEAFADVINARRAS